MSGGEAQLKDYVVRAIREYNKFREPESKAELVSIDGDIVKVRFLGTFTETCGINDWVEDFKYILEDLGVKSELLKVLEIEDRPYERIGIFKVKR